MSQNETCKHSIPSFISNKKKNIQNTVEIRENQKKTSPIAYYLAHVCECSTKKKIICPACFDSVAYPNLLWDHCSKFHKGVNNTYNCQHCSKVFSELLEFYFHSLSHFDVTKVLTPEILEDYCPNFQAAQILDSIVKPPHRYELMQQRTPLNQRNNSSSQNLQNHQINENVHLHLPNLQINQNVSNYPNEGIVPNSSQLPSEGSQPMEIDPEPSDEIFSPPSPSSPTSIPSAPFSVLLSPPNPQMTEEEVQAQIEANDYRLDVEVAPNQEILQPKSFESIQHSNPIIHAPIPQTFTNFQDNKHFPNEKYLKFVLKHVLKFGAKNEHVDALLDDIRDEWGCCLSTAAQLPNNHEEIARSLATLPVLETKNHAYNLPALVQRELSMNPDLISKMEFNYKEPVAGMMTEFVETPRYKELSKKCKKDEVPLVLLLYLDAFRKFRSLFGSADGIYFSFLNLPKQENAKLKNIQTLGIAKTDLEEYLILEQIVQQIKDHRVVDFRLPNGKWVKGRIFIGLDTCDMPQRHDNCHMKRHNSNDIPCFRCNVMKGIELAAEATGTVRNCADWKAKLIEYIGLRKNPRANSVRLDELEKEGVRLLVKNDSGEYVLMSSIPFFEIPGFSCFSCQIV